MLHFVTHTFSSCRDSRSLSMLWHCLNLLGLLLLQDTPVWSRCPPSPFFLRFEEVLHALSGDSVHLAQLNTNKVTCWNTARKLDYLPSAGMHRTALVRSDSVLFCSYLSQDFYRASSETEKHVSRLGSAFCSILYQQMGTSASLMCFVM